MVLNPPTQRTWSVGDIGSAALLNSNVRDSVNYLSNPPVCRCYQATSQSVPNATWTAISMDSNVYDTYNGHSTSVSNSEYIAQIAGYYQISGSVGFPQNSTGVRGSAIYYNGTVQPDADNTIIGYVNVGAALPTGTIQIYMNVGDYVQIYGYQSSGAAMLTVANTAAMNIRWVHA